MTEHIETPGAPTSSPDLREPNAGPGTWPNRILTGVVFVQRMLFGLMFTMSGITWWSREATPGEHLTDSIALSAQAGLNPFPIYDLFFNGLVVPHPELWASLAAIGELLVGLSLLLGFPKRVAAVAGMFLMANYGLAFGNGFMPPSGNWLLMFLFVPLLLPHPYRLFTPVHRLYLARFAS